MYTIPIPSEKARQKTRDRLGEAIYLLLYFIEACDWKTGKIRTTYEKIAAEAGFPLGTVRRWMDVLRKEGEISVLRIPNGVVVTILDYAPIAKTRKVPQVSDRPCASDRSRMSTPETSDRPPLSVGVSAGGHPDCPPVSMRSSAGELSNIKQILSQNHVQSTSQKDSSIDVEGDQSPDPPPEVDSRPKMGPEEARQMLSGLEDLELTALRARAMEELENDPVPFLRKFVRRNSLGELEPNPLWGPYVLEIRMAEILTRGDA